MMVVISYDINTSTPSGAKRLRKVARACETYGCRVQNSVFETLVNPAQLIALKARLLDIIDKNVDSIRFYRLGSNWKLRVEVLGKQPLFEQEDTIIL